MRDKAVAARRWKLLEVGTNKDWVEEQVFFFAVVGKKTKALAKNCIKDKIWVRSKLLTYGSGCFRAKEASLAFKEERFTLESSRSKLGEIARERRSGKGKVEQLGSQV